VKRHLGVIVLLMLLLAVALFIGIKAIQTAVSEPVDSVEQRDDQAVPVEVAEVTSGPIRELRVLSGTLEAAGRFNVASKISGRIEQMLVDLGDPLSRNQVVARIDDDEFVQAVAQAQAELEVRKASRDQSQSDFELAQRDYERAQALRERGIASESELDEIASRLQSTRAALAVAEAQVKQAEAALELAKIRLGYTEVRANWSIAESQGFVSQRYEDAGNTVQASDPIVSVVVLDPLKAVVTVTERDYARLDIGQSATLRTDAYPNRTFDAEVARIAPVFRESSRQAQLELKVPNADRALKPGMFVRVRVVLQEDHAEAIVPQAALVRRSGEDVVFVLNEAGNAVRRVPVQIGITEAGMTQVFGENITGKVVTLGQQLIGDGSRVRVTNEDEPPVEATPAGAEL